MARQPEMADTLRTNMFLGMAHRLGFRRQRQPSPDRTPAQCVIDRTVFTAAVRALATSCGLVAPTAPITRSPANPVAGVQALLSAASSARTQKVRCLCAHFATSALT